MLCEFCHAHPATVHLTQVTEEGIRKSHLCEACAEKAGLDLQDATSLADALLVGLGRKPAAEDDGERCPKCHLRMSDFKRTGRLGCPQCYTLFRDPLRPLVRSTHRADRHTGKAPDRPTAGRATLEDADRLRGALADAVSREAYEEAARLRDRLRMRESGEDSTP